MEERADIQEARKLKGDLERTAAKLSADIQNARRELARLKEEKTAFLEERKEEEEKYLHQLREEQAEAADAVAESLKSLERARGIATAFSEDLQTDLKDWREARRDIEKRYRAFEDERQEVLAKLGEERRATAHEREELKKAIKEAERIAKERSQITGLPAFYRMKAKSK